MRRYLNLWKRTFDYKGVSDRAEYRVPLIVTALLAAATAALWWIGTAEYSRGLMAAGVVTGALFTAHVVPMVSLTVRRLRDAGKKPLWAALSCIAGIGTVIVMLICLFCVSRTGYLPSRNRIEGVYGPPFAPQNNVNEDIYGPPEMIFSRIAEEAGETEPNDPGPEGIDPDTVTEEETDDEN